MFYMCDTPELNIDDFLSQYKKKWISYCEIIILTNGNIILANPSHTKRMSILSGIHEDKLNEAMPLYVSPIHWLINYTKNISVWYDFQILPLAPTEEQMQTLSQLHKEKMIHINFQYVKDRDCDTIPGVLDN